MKFYSGACALIVSTVIATASLADGVAYPSNWRGGPPLPPVNGYAEGYTAPVYDNGYGYARPVYVQPYVSYAQPRTVHVEPPEVHIVPSYIAPSYDAYAGHNYVGAGYDPYYSPGQGPQAGYVQGPPQSRCIVSNLNGTRWQDGCTNVTVNPMDAPYLRQKFSHYQPNSGYTLNLPADNDER